MDITIVAFVNKGQKNSDVKLNEFNQNFQLRWGAT